MAKLLSTLGSCLIAYCAVNVAAQSGRPGPSGGSRYEVTWRGDVLWIYRETFASGANIQRRGETWRIDDLGRLVISIENRENDEPASTQTLVYRRDKQ